jgi:hypothetical protein
MTESQEGAVISVDEGQGDRQAFVLLGHCLGGKIWVLASSTVVVNLDEVITNQQHELGHTAPPTLTERVAELPEPKKQSWRKTQRSLPKFLR